MASIGHGYGSEFHLLRWMGRHRNEFTKQVAGKLNSQTINWFDFNFCNNNSIPDKELNGFSFLKIGENRHQRAYELIKTVRDERSPFFWPGGGMSFSWDAVGQTEDGRYVLCEAKAHKDELNSSIGPKAKGKDAIRKALEETKRRAKIESAFDWSQSYYQFANRLYVQVVLAQFGIDAVLLNIYFLGDSFPPDYHRHCPTMQEEWEEAINKEYETLGIPRKGNDFVDKHVRELFLPVSLDKGARKIGPWGRRPGIVNDND